jgi:hypothetical protein
MSKLLKRALKISLTPAILMIAGKILGIFAISYMYNLPFEIGNDVSGLFSTQIFYADHITTLFVNSFSDLTMLIVIFIPTIYLIVKTSLFQSTISNPKTIVKLAKFNIIKWVTKDNTSFLMIFIWSAFLWIVSSITIANTLQSSAYTWLGIIAGSCAFLVALGAIKTFEVETNKVYPDNKKYY